MDPGQAIVQSCILQYCTDTASLLILPKVVYHCLTVGRCFLPHPFLLLSVLAISSDDSSSALPLSAAGGRGQPVANEPQSKHPLNGQNNFSRIEWRSPPSSEIPFLKSAREVAVLLLIGFLTPACVRVGSTIKVNCQFT